MQTVTKDEIQWKSFLEFASRLYKYSFDDRVLIYAQKPDATAVADMRLWNKRIGRYVNKGTKSIVVFNTTENDLKLQYLFDVSDTNGPPHTLPKVWQLNNETSNKLVDKLNHNWGTEEINLEDIISKEIKNTLKNDLEVDISYYSFSTRNQYINTVEDSINYIISSRCGLDLSRFEDLPAFQNISDFNTKSETHKLGIAICNISEEILREIEKEAYAILKNRRSEENEEESIDRTGISGRERRDTLSNSRDIQGRRDRTDAYGEIRKDGNDISKGELPREVQLVEGGRGIDATDEKSRPGSQEQTGNTGETDDKERSHTESNGHLRNLQTQGYDKKISRGDSLTGDSLSKEIEDESQLSIFGPIDSGPFILPKQS